MGDESHYLSLTESGSGSKRKYDEQTVPSSARRPTGFSSPGSSVPQSYGSVHLVADEIQLARQKAEEIAARIMSGAVSSAVAGGSDVKRPRFDNGIGGFNSNISYGSYMGATSRKIEIPNGRVGVIIGKSGETIKYLQQQSGAKIQVTRDMDADPTSLTRMVELMGTPIEIDKAEQLINDVLAEVADSGGSGTVSRRFAGPGQPGSEHIVINVPNNKVGLVIGKGGETIKNIQASSGARVQVIPLHLPPGDASTERSVHIDGTVDQVDIAKQMVNEVISENRLRNQSASGGYTQQLYQARPPTGWTPPGAPMQQQPGYGYMQPGTYPAASSQYAMPQMPCAGFPPQPTSGGYPAANWDQPAVSMNQQQGQGYDYYGQPPSSQQQMAPAGSAPLDNTGYPHHPQPASVYNQQGQGYTQDGYAAYPQMGYDQQGYSFAPAYGTVSNPSPVQEGNPQGDSSQQPLSQPSATYASSLQSYPPPAQQPLTPQAGYGIPTISNPNYGTNQQPSSVQPGYGSGYGPPPPSAQKPLSNPPVYGQPQLSSNDPSGYALGQPPLSGYNQPSDSTPQRTPSYAAPPPQPGYCPPPYGVLPVGHAPPTYGSSFVNGGGYSQPATYSADGSISSNSRGSYDAPPLATQTVQQGGVAQASPSGQT